MSSLANILVISDNPPELGISAGSTRFYKILKTLEEHSNIFLFYRYGNPAKSRELGFFGGRMDPWSLQDYLEEHFSRFNFDIVFFEGYLSAKTFSYVHILDLFPNAACVVDTIDVHWIRNLLESRIKGTKLDPCEKDLEKNIYEQSDYILTLSSKDENALLAEGISSRKFIRVPILEERRIAPSLNTPGKIPYSIYFIGYFLHNPNVDAISWFMSNVFSKIIAVMPEATFHVIGKGFPEGLRFSYEKSFKKNVIFHGHVENLDTLLESMTLAVFPLRYGSGIKGKVLEAFRYKVPVLCSSFGVEGLEGLENGVEYLEAHSSEEYVTKCLTLLKDRTLRDFLADNAERSL
jgi:hypothetical protein